MKTSKVSSKVSNIDSCIKILFLSADPTEASRLRLSEELRNIRERLRLAQFREKFLLESREAVRPSDISQALLDINPQIVHFAGHGISTGELCFEDILGKIHPIQPNALTALFKLLAEQVNCVVLNCCYSEIQAKAIIKHIPYVVGMNKAIGDTAAIAFAVGFYTAIGAKRSIDEAFDFGRVELRLLGIPEYLTPVLLKKRNNKKAVNKFSEIGNLKHTQQDNSNITDMINSSMTVTQEQKSTEEERLVYAMTGSVAKVDLPKLQAIVALLQEITGDTSIKIVDIEKGSLKLILEGSQESLELLEALFKSGQLTEVLGIPVEDVKILPNKTLENDQDIDKDNIDKQRLAFTITNTISKIDIQSLKKVLTATVDSSEENINSDLLDSHHKEDVDSHDVAISSKQSVVNSSEVEPEKETTEKPFLTEEKIDSNQDLLNQDQLNPTKNSEDVEVRGGISRLAKQHRQFVQDLIKSLQSLAIVLERRGYPASCWVSGDQMKSASFMVSLGENHLIRFLVSDYGITWTEMKDDRGLMNLQGAKAINQLQELANIVKLKPKTTDNSDELDRIFENFELSYEAIRLG